MRSCSLLLFFVVDDVGVVVAVGVAVIAFDWFVDGLVVFG